MSDLPPPAPPEKQRFGDRLWSLRALVAVALASVILGGLGGAALANIADDDDRGRVGPGQGRFGRDDDRRGPGMRNDRQRERWNEWRRDQGQGPWWRNGPPGVPPTARPSGLPTPQPTDRPTDLPSPAPPTQTG